MDREGKPGNMKNSRLNYRIILVILAVAVICGVGISFAVGTAITDLTVSPEPVKIGSGTYIQYTLAQDAKIYINIYNETGDLVKNLLNGTSKLAGTLTQTWDGKDKNGVLVADGNYRITVEAKDTAGAQIGYMEKTVKAARLPAISSVTDTPDPFNPVLGEQSTIKYTLSSNAMVTVTIVKNYITVRTIVLNVPQAAGVQTVLWDGRDDSGNLLADGPVTYQIDAVSPTEPTFKTTYKGTATVEKDNPAITGLAVNPNPLKIAGGSLSISYILSEDAKVTLKIVDSTGATVRTLLNAAAKKSGSNTTSWDGKNDSAVYVPEGNYSAVISAVDYANKPSGEQAITFTAGYLPAISGFSANPSIFNPEDPTTPETAVQYTISRDAVVTVEILNGYNHVKTIIDSELKPAGTYSLTWDGRYDTGNIAGDADYTVQITAVSPTVGTFSSKYKGTVTVEKGAPGITDVKLTPEPFKLGAGNLSVSYSLTENSAVYINVYRGDVLVKQLVNGTSRNTGVNTTSWNGKDEAGSNVPEGIYTVTIKAIDRFGNWDQAQNNVTCGYLPAVSGLSIVPSPFNPVLDVNAVVYFNLSYEAKVTLSILSGSTAVRTISVGTLPAGSGYAAWDGKNDAGAQVADGSYTYQIEAVSPTVDTFKSTAKGTVTVEADKPRLTDVSVSPSIAKIGSSATITYTVSEPAVISGQVLKAQDRTVVRDLAPVTKNAGGTYTLTWDTKDNLGNPATTGSYIVTLTALDNSGKTGSGEAGFQAAAVPVISNAVADPAVVDLAVASQTVISYTVSEDSVASVKLYNSAGSLVRTLCSFKSVPTGQDAVLWDCKNSTGALVTGIFTYKIDANSALGNFRAQQVTGTIEVTGTPPPPPPSCTSCHTTFPPAQTVPGTNAAAIQTARSKIMQFNSILFFSLMSGTPSVEC